MSNYKNPEKGKVYASPVFVNHHDKSVRTRVVSKILDSEEAYAFTDIKGERVIRLTDSASTNIKATFHVDSREISVLTVQGYTVATDKPHNANFSFIGDEIDKLLDFVRGIQEYQFKSVKTEVINFDDFTKSKQNENIISDNHLFDMVVGKEDLIKEIIKSDIRTEDLVAIGYRKKQLNIFERLLNDEEFFNDIKVKKKCTSEGVWQKFFEKNPWIFGYGLGYIFMTNLDDKKLEQVVKGFDLNSYGKRVDGLMKTRGAISNLCFVEIKTNITKLLSATAYRKGCWSPSSELSGALAQIRGTVDSALRNISSELYLVDEEGNPTGEELFNYKPKLYIVIGDLRELISTNGVNKDKLRSFELYRNNINDVEIITFDELYERASFIVNNHKV